MKYSVTKDAEGRIALQLGLNHFATFEPDATPEHVVMGVTALIEKVVGISAFELANAVASEFGWNEKE